MIKEHIIETFGKEKGETPEHIAICRKCPFPASKCNGECDYYKAKAKELKAKKRLKKNVILY